MNTFFVYNVCVQFDFTKIKRQIEGKNQKEPGVVPKARTSTQGFKTKIKFALLSLKRQKPRFSGFLFLVTNVASGV